MRLLHRNEETVKSKDKSYVVIARNAAGVTWQSVWNVCFEIATPVCGLVRNDKKDDTEAKTRVHNYFNNRGIDFFSTLVYSVLSTQRS